MSVVRPPLRYVQVFRHIYCVFDSSFMPALVHVAVQLHPVFQVCPVRIATTHRSEAASGRIKGQKNIENDTLLH